MIWLKETIATGVVLFGAYTIIVGDESDGPLSVTPIREMTTTKAFPDDIIL